MSRKPISKRTRFEVFKRDSFTCQYCGRRAPDVLLHCDHIEPASAGGATDVINLVTSCADCNLGKSDRKLSDSSVVEKQREQLAQLQERRRQMEMMAAWRAELSKLEDYSLILAEEAWSKAADHQYTVSQNGRDILLKLIKKHGLNAVFDGIEGAARSYLLRDENGYFTKESVALSLQRLPAVISVQMKSKDKPWLQRLFYARGILRNRLNYVDEKRAISLMESAVVAGADAEEMVDLAKRVRNWSQFRDAIEDFLAGDGEQDGAN